MSSMIALSVALSIALPAVGCAIGQGILAAKALEGIARQPEAAGVIRTSMILGLAMIEALSIYGLLVAIILSGKI